LAKVLFIPSCEVAAIDTLEGTETEIRLKAGLEEWKKGAFDVIAVAGGVYLPPELQTRPSGTLMKEWLLTRGLTEHQVVAETNSRDTYENISGVVSALWGRPIERIAVITQWQHALRFWVTFRRAHGVKAEIIPLWYSPGLSRFLKEWLFLLIHVFDATGTSPLVMKNKQNCTFPKPATS
jgi:uncharacterized SAM-binding protein YcdF (DUF218 family)